MFLKLKKYLQYTFCCFDPQVHEENFIPTVTFDLERQVFNQTTTAQV
jgi:hypothetical protein